MKNTLYAIGLLALMVACKQKELTDPVTPDPPVIPPIVPPVTPPTTATFRLLDSTQMSNDLKLLSSDAFKGRAAGTPEIELTYQLIKARLRTAGVDSFATGFEQPFTTGSVQRKNFIGFIKGSVNPDKYIVLGAHFDHLGVVNGAIYHGADDNASGVSAVLASAKYFKQHPPAYSIIFALWDGEEVGLRGSSYFVNNLPTGLTLASLKFNLNADMIARSDNNKIWGVGLTQFPAYKYLVDSLKDKTTSILASGYDNSSFPENWVNSSDHASFYSKGIAFLYLGVEDHVDYHKPTDTYENVNLNKFTENANIFLQMALLLDRKL